MKGTNISCPAETGFEAEVRKDTDLGCSLKDLAKAMDPNKPHGIRVRIE